jgi:hypothetical protein
MKTVNLADVSIDLDAAIDLARKEPLLLLTPDGQEFLMAPADSFEQEVEILRRSESFQRFLDARSACARRTSLNEVEARIERELTAEAKSD